MNILVTGGTGLVGSAIKKMHSSNDKFVFVGSKDYNLVEPSDVDRMFKDNKFEAIIHLAARVGGVKGNSDHLADFFYENIMINTNVLNMARKHNVSKVLSLLSTCVYPDNAVYPLTEDQIHNGEPHDSNFGYAYAKRMLDVHSRAIKKQYGLDYITAVPNNIYGINDNFDLLNGHALPTIIRKIHEAKISGKPPVFWGSGRTLREFTLSDDVAKALLSLIKIDNIQGPINIGNTGEYKMFDIIKTIARIFDYNGEILWDKEKPEGQLRKPSCNKKFLNIMPNFKYTSIDDGLLHVCEWFANKYPDVRGVLK